MLDLEDYYPDEEDLSELFSLKQLDRPALTPKSFDPAIDNIYQRFDTPGWRMHNLHADDELVSKLSKPIDPAARQPPMINEQTSPGNNSFETSNTPAIITHAMDTWPCYTTRPWTFATFLTRFPETMFRFSDTHGGMLPYFLYHAYTRSQHLGLIEDSPLAIYDSEFGDDDATKGLLDDYTVPKIFSDDIFHIGGTEECPPHRWILMGPKRSGTGLHIDPLWTNAWVALITGRKRWMLFPPKTPPHLLGVLPDQPQKSSAVWFAEYYDTVTSPSWPAEYKPYEILQNPGEIVYVPNGWFHLVLNVEESVAVTHNYACEHGPFERMYGDVVENEPEFAVRWRKAMGEKRPDLEERIRKWEETTGEKEEGYSSRLGFKTN